MITDRVVRRSLFGQRFRSGVQVRSCRKESRQQKNAVTPESLAMRTKRSKRLGLNLVYAVQCSSILVRVTQPAATCASQSRG